MNTDIRHLDLNLLKALDALLDERSVTRAAQRLALTQPAVSGMLNRLRESFDDPLFVRGQRGITPTLRAEQLAIPVKRLLADIEGLLKPSEFDPSTAQLTVTLASTDYALQAVVAPFLAALRLRAPNVRVCVLPVDEQALPAQMERGDVDLALLTPQTVAAGLQSAFLFDEAYVCLLRADHADASGQAISLERFCALDHALVSPSGGAFRGVTDDALARIGRTRRVTLSLSSFLVLPQILMTSDLIAVVPSRLAQQRDGLRVLQPPIEIPGFSKTLAWHERTERDPAHRWIRALLIETVAAAHKLCEPLTPFKAAGPTA
ncbi:HTH-type transcriptional activator NahR [Pseudomonas reidholzensis]|uniref:HTH-type transcriptional activator NahR n=1 Tax=Pseudomonas reidholzensis TaxID=1785162 RepID=A0A383RTS1_9PSED|nr:LysR family transcriptional regulator [Pseudomonas reidholzensis]SYX90459.1 HTH-type transcriptional activator NahR [Pseudomonas reidholzensis]